MTKLPFIFVLFVLFSHAKRNGDIESQNLESKNDFVRNTFGTLLKSIVKINEQRFDAMKKLAKLQDYNAAMDSLRNGNNDDSSGSILALLIIDGGKNQNREFKRQSTVRMDSEELESGSGSKETKSTNMHNENSLRVWKSCQKKAAKVCRKACVDAHKSTCSEFACSKRLKKAFKKECKRACKKRFT